MGDKVISICKNGVRYDMTKQDTKISQGTIVTLRGHKGKVLLVEGDEASVSWEDASISKVPIKDLTYDSRVEKGGPGSGRHKEGGSTELYPGDYVRFIVRNKDGSMSQKKGTLHSINAKTNEHKIKTDDGKIYSKIGQGKLGYIHYEKPIGKGGAGSGRFSDDATGVKLGVARHLRRQGVLGRKKA